MLIQFKVTNFRSIAETLTFSMAAGSEPEIVGELSKTFNPDAPATKNLVKTSLVYGPNASGKSTLIKAMQVMRDIIVDSVRTQENDELPYEPFLLSKEKTAQDTEFEMELISDGVRYQYGFAYNKTRISEEWLFAYPKGRAQKWIMRFEDDETNEPCYERCESLQGSKKLWESATRTNALFLSTAVQLKSAQLMKVLDWFQNTLRFISSDELNSSHTIRQSIKAGTEQQLLNFMKAADFNISDFAVNEPDLLQDVPQPLELKTGHLTEEGEMAYFDFEQESDGTQKVFELAGPWLDAFKNGYVLVMDEMNLHLHPKLAAFLVSLFYNTDMNQQNSQLLLTTHETSLLSEQLVRRDQVWLMNKLNNGSSQLDALTSFSARKNESLRKRYLDGRYGGIPITNLSDMTRNRKAG